MAGSLFRPRARRDGALSQQLMCRSWVDGRWGICGRNPSNAAEVPFLRGFPFRGSWGGPPSPFHSSPPPPRVPLASPQAPPPGASDPTSPLPRSSALHDEFCPPLFRTSVLCQPIPKPNLTTPPPSSLAPSSPGAICSIKRTQVKCFSSDRSPVDWIEKAGRGENFDTKPKGVQIHTTDQFENVNILSRPQSMRDCFSASKISKNVGPLRAYFIELHSKSRNGK